MQALSGSIFRARAAAVNASAVALHSVKAPARNAVNLSALKNRIRATMNVSKITNVMKLVASSKLRSVEEALMQGRVFGESIFNAVALPKDETTTEKDDENAMGLFLDDKKHLCVIMTTDRGLCGAVNSSIARRIRKELNAAVKANTDVRVFTIGEKGRSQVARDYIPLMAGAVDGCFDRDPIFPLAAALASKIVQQPYDVLTIVYNHYENQAKFVNNYRQIPQIANMKPGELPAKLTGYEVEPADNSEALINLQEYAVASAIYYAMLETSACETSQRVMAMDNATENANEMVHSLSLIYNRARQAKITTELTEIISGAESLNDGVTEE